MKLRELKKYGYPYKNQNFKGNRILTFKNEQDIEKCKKDFGEYLKIENICFPYIDEYLSLFFDTFPKLEVGGIFYVAKEKNLYFTNVSSKIEEQDKRVYTFLCNQAVGIPGEMISLTDLMQEISYENLLYKNTLDELEKLSIRMGGLQISRKGRVYRFPYHKIGKGSIYSVKVEDSIFYMKRGSYVDYLIHEYREKILEDVATLALIEETISPLFSYYLDEDMWFELNGEKSGVHYKHKLFDLNDYKVAQCIPNSLQAKRWKEFEKYEIDIRALPKPLKEKFKKKEEKTLSLKKQ